MILQGCSVFRVKSIECFSHIVLEFGYALADIIKGPVSLLLLVEQLRLGTVHHYLHTRHIQDPVVQELVQLRHLVQQEQLVHMHRVTCYYQLTRLDPQGYQVLQDVLFSLLDCYRAVHAGKSETGFPVMPALFMKYLVHHSSMVWRCAASQWMMRCGPSCLCLSFQSVSTQANSRMRWQLGLSPLIQRSIHRKAGLKFKVIIIESKDYCNSQRQQISHN